MADASEHQHHNTFASSLTLAGSGAAAAVSLAPTILPKLGLGDPYLGEEATNLMHIHNVPGEAVSYGEGLAGLVNGGIASVPVVGKTLAENGMASIGATALIGIGGVLLANWLEKREAPNAEFRWSKVVRNLALVTSALIALPSILTGISTGITYFGLLGGVEAGSAVAGAMTTTLGAAAGHAGALSLLGVAVPHLLLCGAIIAPLALAFFMGQKKAEKADTPSPVTQGPLMLDGRVQTPAQPAIAHAH